MDLYAIMLKGLMEEQSDETKALYKEKLEDFKRLLLTEDENEQMAIMSAMIVALVDSGLLED